MKEISVLFFRISSLAVFVLIFSSVRPAYSIPTSLSELEQMIGEFCAEYSFLDFCAIQPTSVEAKEQQPIWENLTESEKEILLQLLERQQALKEREQGLDRRENQLKALQEDVQRQIAQLERLQEKIQKDIAVKKLQDSQQLDKAIEFYRRMDPATAAQSLANLDQKIAVNILIKMNPKNSSEILANMAATKSADLIAAIAKKK